MVMKRRARWIVDIAYLDDGAVTWVQEEVYADSKNQAAYVALLQLSPKVRHEVTQADVLRTRPWQVSPMLEVV
jgi:hypothetical protein